MGMPEGVLSTKPNLVRARLLMSVVGTTEMLEVSPVEPEVNTKFWFTLS